MSIDLAVQMWKESRSFIHDSFDKKEAAEAVSTVLMEHFDADDIAEAFKFDKNIINSIAEYIDDEELEEIDDYHDDDEY
jgi:hypothetical protein